MNKPLKNLLAIASLSLAGLTGPVVAKELTAEEDFALALKALPEAADDLDNSSDEQIFGHPHEVLCRHPGL